MKDLEKILNLKDYKIMSIEDVERDKKKIKIISIISKNNKQKCPICNEYTSSIHDVLKPIELKYLKLFEQDTRILITKRRFICHKCNKRFTEEVDLNNHRKSVSNKLEQKILKDLLNYNLSISFIAKENGLSPGTVRNIFRKAMSGYPEHIINLQRVISFDEFKADTNRGKYAFVLNDLIHRKCLDILPERKKEYLLSYFTHCNNRYSVEYIISDMYEPYLLVQKAMFPKAKYVVDRFHYTRYIMDALDKVRIRLQKTFGYNSKEYRLLKNKKNISLLRKYSNDIDWWTYTRRYKNKHLVEILKFDLKQELLKIKDEFHDAYILKEIFLDLINHSDYKHAEEELKSWLEMVKEYNIPEMLEAASTIENWLPYIVNSFIDKRFSNGFTEGLNNKIKVIKRVGFGYKDFRFFRLRILYIMNGTLSGITKKDRNSKK